MDISPEEARPTLNEIQHPGTAAQKMGSKIAASYMLLWGVIWTIGFLLSQFLSQWMVWLWTGIGVYLLWCC